MTNASIRNSGLYDSVRLRKRCTTKLMSIETEWMTAFRSTEKESPMFFHKHNKQVVTLYTIFLFISSYSVSVFSCYSLQTSQSNPDVFRADRNCPSSPTISTSLHHCLERCGLTPADRFHALILCFQRTLIPSLITLIISRDFEKSPRGGK